VSPTQVFVELDKSLHDRSTFDCGEPELNTFIKTQAMKHMAAGISRTLLLPSTTPLGDGTLPIRAFYTISVSAISKKSLPPDQARKLPHYPIPVFVLAQLAVHHSYQTKGLGKITLITALKHFVAIQAHMKAYAIVVDCLNQHSEKFYSKYGFEKLCIHNDRVRMFLPMKIVEQLF